jgi:hypothetical protein
MQHRLKNWQNPGAGTKTFAPGFLYGEMIRFSSVFFGFDEDLDLIGTLTVFLQVILELVGKHKGRLFFAVCKEHVDLVGIPALA